MKLINKDSTLIMFIRYPGNILAIRIGNGVGHLFTVNENETIPFTYNKVRYLLQELNSTNLI